MATIVPFVEGLLPLGAIPLALFGIGTIGQWCVTFARSFCPSEKLPKCSMDVHALLSFLNRLEDKKPSTSTAYITNNLSHVTGEFFALSRKLLKLGISTPRISMDHFKEWQFYLMSLLPLVKTGSIKEARQFSSQFKDNDAFNQEIFNGAVGLYDS